MPEVKITFLPAPEQRVHRLVKASNIHQARLVREPEGEFDRVILPVKQFASETEGIVPFSQVEVCLV